jgi:thioredoxin-like negative regulator of GroEL
MPNEYFLTVYVTSWDEPSRRYIQNLEGFRHKVIDIDENPVIAAEQKIKAVPTTQIYDTDGNLLVTKIGCATAEIIKEWIKENVGNSES